MIAINAPFAREMMREKSLISEVNMRDKVTKIMPKFEIGICDLLLAVIEAPSAQAAKDTYAQTKGWKNEAAMAAANGSVSILWATPIPDVE